jgi:hypothetical protein
MFGSSLPPVVCRRANVLFTLYVCSGVQHIVCCVFVLFFLVLCTLWCQFLWIAHFLFPLCCSLTFMETIHLLMYEVSLLYNKVTGMIFDTKRNVRVVKFEYFSMHDFCLHFFSSNKNRC